ncbi:MAG: hypothetical protein R3E32_29665 [Chitinophagales bacterium]
MTTIYGVYDQIAEVIALLEPKKILALKASKEVQDRFDLLMEKSRGPGISKQEYDELNHFIVLERLLRLAKIKADISLRNG